VLHNFVKALLIVLERAPTKINIAGLQFRVTSKSRLLRGLQGFGKA